MGDNLDGRHHRGRSAITFFFSNMSPPLEVVRCSAMMIRIHPNAARCTSLPLACEDMSLTSGVYACRDRRALAA